MEPVSELFDRMDEWRRFPNYQLERRADIFFSLYLPEVLEAKLGVPMCHDLAAELPVRKREPKTTRGLPGEGQGRDPACSRVMTRLVGRAPAQPKSVPA